MWIFLSTTKIKKVKLFVNIYFLVMVMEFSYYFFFPVYFLFYFLYIIIFPVYFEMYNNIILFYHYLHLKQKQ